MPYLPFLLNASFCAERKVLGNSVAFNCMSLSGCKDGGVQCARAIRVQIGWLFLWGKSDSENGALGAQHIGVENGYHHSLWFSFLFHHKVLQRIPTKSYFFQDHATHLYHNERWIMITPFLSFGFWMNFLTKNFDESHFHTHLADICSPVQRSI